MPQTAVAAADFYAQFTDSIKSIHELATRTDERMKTMVDRQNSFEAKIESVISSFKVIGDRLLMIEAKDFDKRLDALEARMPNELERRLVALETQMPMVLGAVRTSESRWQRIVDSAWKVMVSVAAAAAIYVFGFKR